MAGAQVVSRQTQSETTMGARRNLPYDEWLSRVYRRVHLTTVGVSKHAGHDRFHHGEPFLSNGPSACGYKAEDGHPPPQSLPTYFSRSSRLQDNNFPATSSKPLPWCGMVAVFPPPVSARTPPVLISSGMISGMILPSHMYRTPALSLVPRDTHKFSSGFQGHR